MQKRRSRMTKTGSNLNLVHRKIYILSYPYQNWVFFTREIRAGHILFEPCYEKTGILHFMRKQKTQISCAVTAQLISAFVFAIRIVQSLYYLNPNFQAAKHLLWLYSPVCVGPGLKPRRPVFSERGSFYG